MIKNFDDKKFVSVDDVVYEEKFISIDDEVGENVNIDDEVDYCIFNERIHYHILILEKYLQLDNKYIYCLY